ncbi:MAG: DNA translocase FtsK 4TM domain-containing protein [Candidatus Electryonea clarkiae]|nr:DNA translocase FtsK 4TM domain-containing protein [Candidatus Electryonea clarkiae]MDP8288114.1 DNA translocase FtsK 4TM domain-containing protein [Candidatus Electryonea clarkiae]
MAKKAVKNKSKKSKSKKSRGIARDVTGIALITIAILIGASIVSYNPLDPPNGSASIVSNRLNIAGAYIAFYLIHFTFGRILSLFIPIMMLIFAIELIRKKGYRQTFRNGLKLFIGVILATAIWEIIRDLQGIHGPLEFTGFIGFWFVDKMLEWLGRTGSVIILTGLALIYLTFTLRIRWAIIVNGFHTVFSWLGGLFSILNTSIRSDDKPGSKPKISHGSLLSTDDSDFNEQKNKDLFEPGSKIRDDIEIIDDKESLTEGTNSLNNIDLNTETIDDNSESIYLLPTADLLNEPEDVAESDLIDKKALHETAAMLEERLAEFGVKAKVVQIHPGPIITRFDLKPAPGVKIGRISSLADDLALALAARSIRIQAPIPGAGAVGIEVPNKHPKLVVLREIIETPVFQDSDKPLLLALGRSADGEVFVTDLAKMPHLMIAGTTGSGKSVCINTIIASILFKNKPDEVLIAMIDPKKLELSTYAELRRHHLLFIDDGDEVIATDPKNAVALLQSVVKEMEKRYTRLAEVGSRSITEYNESVEAGKVKPDENGNPAVKLPYIVVIIDELADLMLTAAKEVEEPIARLAQMARAIGIHLVVATQRPSVDVITGVIKANFPARLAFMVASKIDSRTILDRPGAESLLGKGDSLLMSNDAPFPLRIHGALITTDEVHRLIVHIVRQPAFIKRCKLDQPASLDSGTNGFSDGIDARDELFNEAVKLVVRHQQGSVSLIQRRLRVGYSRAGRILDQLEQAGVVGPFEGSKAREVMMDDDDLETFLQ